MTAAVMLHMLVLAALPTDAEVARHWPCFRGSASGVITGEIPSDFDGPGGRNIRWKSPIPLPGNNSPIVWGDHIFLSGATKERQEVFCFDTETGALRWRKEIGKPDPAKAPKMAEEAGYAPSTMATDGQRVFVIFPTGDLAALDFAGQVVWTKNFGKLDSQYGFATSLLTWHDRLIAQLDQGLDAAKGKSQLLALDSASGREVWKTPRPVANSWASPIIAQTPAGPIIVTAANPWVIAYEPESGKELWRADCLHGDIAPSPAYANGLVVVAMENSDATAIRVGGSGDVMKTHVAWMAQDSLPDIVSPVMTDKCLIVVTTNGTVTCYDTGDGHKLWDHDFPGPFHASPLVAGDVVHLIDANGKMLRFEAGPKFKLLSESNLGEQVNATPAVANGRLYIRSESNLFCIGSK